MRQDRPIMLVTPAMFQALNQSFSAPRWRTYLREAGFRTDVAHALYLWNVEIGQSFQFPMHTAEVALRNVINQALISFIGPDWWQTHSGRAMLGTKRCQDIDAITSWLQGQYSTMPNTDQIAASLTMGFWTAMLGTRFHRRIWSREMTNAFPHLSPQETIQQISDTANATRRLRQKVPGPFFS